MLKGFGAAIAPIFFIILVAVLLLGAGSLNNSSGTGEVTGNVKLPAKVLRWKEKVIEECEKNGIPEAVNSNLAIIAVETGGDSESYPDIMQCSESQGRPPNSIQDPNESIEVGVKYFADMYKGSGKKDVWNVTQAYNYGGGYLAHSGDTYSFEAAMAFSAKMANGQRVSYPNPVAVKLGYDWRYNYGNMFYVALCKEFFSVSEGTGDFIIPVNNPIVTSGFANRIHPQTGLPEYHLGLDFANDMGSPIMASKSGTVVLSEFNSSYGNYIIIDHGDGTWTAYAHQSKLIAGVGDSVEQGEVIGLIGSTGDSTGAHLHFEIRNSIYGDHIDPAPILGVTGT